MAPGRSSRHLSVPLIADLDDGLTYLLDREPLRFAARSDNLRVVSQEGDTWHSLAARHLRPLPRPQDFWWVLCDFQPVPVADPTVEITPGTVVFIPSAEFVTGRALTETQAEDTVI